MQRSQTCIVRSILICLIAWCYVPSAHGSTADLVKKVQPATVMISVYDNTGRVIRTGSGFLFKYHGHLITNYHVLGDALAAKVKTVDGAEFSIRAIEAVDQGDDLVEAVADIPSGSSSCLAPAGTVPRAGDPVMIIGSPLGVEKVVSEGTVTSIQEVPGRGKCIVHSAHSFPGSSGSPLVNANGEVIGIDSAGVVGRPDISIAVPLDRFSGLKPTYRALQPAPTSTTVARQKNNVPETLEKEKQSADSGDPVALVELGKKYELGNGVNQNCFEALSLYRRAAGLGSAQGQYHVGRMYYDGRCMGRNRNEAAQWLQKAADRGCPEAQRMFGTLCYNGEGVPRDKVNACMWTILAAFQKDQEAIRILQLMSAELTPDERKAAQEKARSWKPAR